MEQRKYETRAWTRFRPDPNTLAVVEIPARKGSSPRVFTGLVVNESLTGCSAVFPTCDELTENAVCLIRVGKLAVMEAEVRWRVRLDGEVVRLGFLYRE